MRSNTETMPDFEPRMDLTTSLYPFLSLSLSLYPSSILSLFVLPLVFSCAYTHTAKETLPAYMLFTLDSCGRSPIEQTGSHLNGSHCARVSIEGIFACVLYGLVHTGLCTVRASRYIRSRDCVRKNTLIVYVGSTF